jgi:transcriptional enhancer factor
MTVPNPASDFSPTSSDDSRDDKNLRLEHRYSGSTLKSMMRGNLEAIPNWRSRFPLLARAQPIDRKCEIIHMEVSLAIRNGLMPESAELWGHFEIIIPGEEEVRANWRCMQSLYKPNDLYGPAETDPRYENVDSAVAAERYEPGVGTHMRVSFPANTWAYALVKIAELEQQFEEASQSGKPFPTTMSARQYIDQISMYQDIFCSVGHDTEYKRKAIILWTFKKSSAGEKGESSWRYLDPAPSRRDCFSPHPGQGHVVSAAMVENFHAWAEPQQIQIQPPGPYDPLLQGLQTPPHSAVLQSPFGFSSYPPPHHDMPGENLSFMSHETDTTDSTLVEPSQHFMASSGSVSLDFEQAQNMWAAPPIESFDGENQFLVNYSTVQQPVQGQVWDGSETKQHHWENADLGFANYEAHLGTRLK